MIKEHKKKAATPIINPDTDLEVKKKVFMSVPYVPGLSEEFEESFDIPVYNSITTKTW